MADNTTYTKATFKTVIKAGNGGQAVKERDGYEFTAFAVEGKLYKLYVYHDEDGKWRTVDPMTGQSITTGATREAAVKEAAEPSTVMYFSNMLKSEKYTKMCDRFLDLVSGGKPAPKPEPKPEVKAAPKPKAKPKAAKKSAAKPKAPSKPKPKEESDLVSALAELATVKKELEDLKSGKLDEMIAAKANEMFGGVYEKISADLDKIIGGITVEQADKMADELPSEVENVAATWTIADARKWAAMNGYTADQVNPERKDCIWIYGVRKDDKPMHERLTKMGLRWGGKGWYVDPKRAKK